MGVHAERDSRVGVTQAGGDNVDGDAREQKRRGMDMPEIVQPCVR